MRVTKPNWVKHTDDKDRKSPIFSCSVHPDGTRLATGGLDKKVKIWSTVPILDSDADADEANHKLLCTMSSHTGSVLAVRWSHDGRFLASGSDDMVIVIWGIDPDGGGRVFGSDEVNVENWKALTRLVGHTADIIDIAWSRDDTMMASVGLDKMVWIWDGATFDRIRKLDLHGDFVKGVCWDPVGEFLATQSDDKTVKIWDTKDWSLVKSVEKPFENSPKSTFFRRLSWSPDGAFIAASNAMNGPVFVAAVIEREGWNSDISFVGHANTIQVAAFNPRLFFRAGDQPGRATASCMVALGADDFSISIWRNTLHKPLVVLQDIFSRPLLDLCWANDGHHLYGCSADGTICAITFEPVEFPELAEMNKTEVVLKEYGYVPRQRAAIRKAPLQLPPPSATLSNGFGALQAASGSHVNVLQPRKGKPKPLQKRRIDLGRNNNGFGPPPQDSGDAFSSAPIQPFASSSHAQASTARMFQDVHSAFGGIGALNGDHEAGPSRGHKRKAGYLDEGPISARGKIMGSSTVRSVEVKEIRAPRAAPIASSSGGTIGKLLGVPTVQSTLRSKSDTGEDIYLEVHNAENERSKNKVVYVQDGEDQWVDFLPTAVLVLTVTELFAAVGTEDGTLTVYSPGGRHLLRVKLEAPVVEIASRRDALVAVTADCTLRVFDVRSGKALFPPTSISHLLDSPGLSLDVDKVDVRPNGTPIVITTEPTAYAYDRTASAWITLSSSWWNSSPLSSASTSTTIAGPLSDIERYVANKGGRATAAGEEQWWDEAMGLGHLELKLKAAEVIQSRAEWQHWLGQYTTVLAREGFRGRAEELIRDLIGPIGRTADTQWKDTIMGLSKVVLLRSVLERLGQGKLADLARQYHALLGPSEGSFEE